MNERTSKPQLHHSVHFKKHTCVDALHADGTPNALSAALRRSAACVDVCVCLYARVNEGDSYKKACEVHGYANETPQQVCCSKK